MRTQSPLGIPTTNTNNNGQYQYGSIQPLFAINAGKSNMDALEAFEKELEWHDATTRLTDASPPTLHDDIDPDDLDAPTDPSSTTTYLVPESLHDKRIDAVLSALDATLSRSRCQALVSAGLISVTLPSSQRTTTIARKSEQIPSGSTLHIRTGSLNTDQPDTILPENLPLTILYEDAHMIVLNKAAGMVVHPGAGNRNGTVVNALAHYLAHSSPYGAGEFVTGDTHPAPATTADAQRLLRPGIVHRLDKGTTGVLVVARTRAALAALSLSFARREVRKTYLAVTVGSPGERVVIDRPIGRHPLHRQRMRVVPDPTQGRNGRTRENPARVSQYQKAKGAQAGRNALTFVDTLATDGKLAVYGDDVYGRPEFNRKLKKTHGVDRPLLHAMELEVEHPAGGGRMVFRAGVAADMERVVEAIYPEGVGDFRESSAGKVEDGGARCMDGEIKSTQLNSNQIICKAIPGGFSDYRHRTIRYRPCCRTIRYR